MMKPLFLLLYSIAAFQIIAQGSFAPSASTIGTTAMHKDSSAFVSWATGCSVIRGWQNVADTTLGKVDAGTPTDGTGKPGTNGVVSLGDQGEAILTFDHPIINGSGYDFAVFENSFSDDFLELAFVEVSSDGTNFFRFKSVSETQYSIQTGSFGSLDASNIYNLAGKYRGQFGTPFDLNELINEPGLDINHITHVKIIDVVGSIDSKYASYDSLGNIINDPFPTAFGSGGFDLDAVGVIHHFIGIDENSWKAKMFPNPCKDLFHLKFEDTQKTSLKVFNPKGQLIMQLVTLDKNIEINFSDQPIGVYFLHIIREDGGTMIKKLIVN